MRIEKRQVEGQPLTVIIEYPEWNDSVESLVRKIGRMDISFVGKTEEGSVSIGISDVYYIENVERKLFIYTEGDVYRFDGSMSDIESRIEDTALVRISRTCIMNTDHLKEIRQIRNSHLEAVMDNDEKLIVSRKYLPDIKRIFRNEGL
ncbi:MAG: LytTR family transcriptional regulator DNA-binding domain-containing protein [Lachnospiraceae bacterium]|nr:LytTR family transcriptional regulator DNA-binding domain-containing protein [Lachnospiraceae bacterium]MBO7531065.1 LytTR family transcriptional regulator DNA-binding domain-containing protein [Lachnospiraceae bacterium]MBP5252223.1 LytTR family transcriptional regulator DNA-binding domain-containing protein [Lachnospiraceae bacterium]MBP5471278.1 LytTR family transcriptional regulator DNA-binding domain-containing protein [Lachnospiraceae bacterium]MBP5702339.1 LytTR family transcriptional